MNQILCFHTWNTSARHMHACYGHGSCHPAPCQCQCGAEDHCTLNPSQGPEVVHDYRMPDTVRDCLKLKDDSV